MQTKEDNSTYSKVDAILITGATGFIGSHVAEYFSEKGLNITCLIRKNSNTSFLKTLPVKIVQGDITNFESVLQACRNVSGVIHLAALAKDWGTYKQFYNVNVVGTLNVLKACKKNNIRHIIVTGSNSSYGEQDSTIVKDESYPFHSNYDYFLNRIFPCAMNHYRNSKALCTEEAVKFAKKNRINLTILEPVFVFGEREFNTGFYEYMKVVVTNVPLFMGKASNRFHVIYAKDLARAYYLAYTKNRKGVHRYLIGNESVEFAHIIFSLFCKYLNKRQPMNLPKFITYPIGLLLELLYTLVRAHSPPLLTRGRVNLFYDNNIYSVEKAKNQLGFKSSYTLNESIYKTVRWYKDNKLI